MEPPRTLEQRREDALTMLRAQHSDAWVATASESGEAHLVPLSFAWHDGRVILATPASAVTTRNLLASKRARLGFGTTRDLVMMDARLVEHLAARDAGAIGERYAEQADWDPRTSPDEYAYLLLEPRRIQAWREANELASRTLMRGGVWLC